MGKFPPKRPSVKCVSCEAMDVREHRKNFITDTKLGTLLTVANAGQRGIRDYPL